MFRIALITIFIAAALAVATPAPSMYSDRIARKVGDIVMVEIQENSTATASAKTNTKGEYKADFEAGGSGALDFIPLLNGGGSSKSEHKGDGRTTRQGSLQATVTAKVVEVFSNGYLRIEGQKDVIINGEKQLTIIKGVVRPEDITFRNTVSSDLISDAQITFKGKGVVGNAERPGIIARIIDWIF